MHRHAAHRNILPLMLAALGEDDAERLRGDLGVLEEHLVEIAHAVKQQVARIDRLDLQELRHGRRDVTDWCARLLVRHCGIVSVVLIAPAFCPLCHPDAAPGCSHSDHMAHGAVRGKWRVVHRASGAYRRGLHNEWIASRGVAGGFDDGFEDVVGAERHLDVELLVDHPVAQPVGQPVPRLGGADVSRMRRVKNLAQLAASVGTWFHRADRLRFLRAWAERLPGAWEGRKETARAVAEALPGHLLLHGPREALEDAGKLLVPEQVDVDAAARHQPCTSRQRATWNRDRSAVWTDSTW